jgi:acyl-CoA dehydrogenase
MAQRHQEVVFMSAILVILFVAALWALAWRQAPAPLWAIAGGVGLIILSLAHALPAIVLLILWIIFIAAALLLYPSGVRLERVSRPLLDTFRRILPRISPTEQEALDAGTVWWDGDLFSGNPDWDKLLTVPRPRLSDDERAFIDGPVEELCRMLDDWRITHEFHDLPPEAWQFIRDKGFLGMIIPKEYGGMGFSALAHSEVIMKLTSRCGTGAVSVMVPNSLGPAELLLHYGTEEQKNHYLPRLARGLEMPCFALTGPDAGSDAGSIPDVGVVCSGEFDGAEVLGIRLNWEKRYITLGPVATLLGLAFKLRDPDRLLGDDEDIGITLALIPVATPGISIGRRHFPLNAVFQNGPNWGRDVFIPLEWVIGGRERVGQGWTMLMNCLAAGRSISLPANSVGVAKLAARTTGAYARVRVQFDLPIGRFEGVEEALARIGGNTYLMDAVRVMTAGAIDLGEKPSVISAIVKYHLTERARQVINDAMDVHGGKGICMGPKNYLARPYQATPIAITVEGANILTRTLMIFGQGAIRGHPYVLREIAATRESDDDSALHDFDRVLFEHVSFTLRNAARALFLAFSGGRGVRVPGAPETRCYYRQLTRVAAAFALATDVSMMVLGGALKRREKLSARLGDILSQLYLCSAALKRYEDQGRSQADLPLLEWALQDALARIQVAFDGVLANFPNRPLAWLMRGLMFPLGRAFHGPSDRLGHEVAALLMEPSAVRDRLTAGMYLPQDGAEPLAELETALRAALAAEPVEAKLRAARKAETVSGHSLREMADDAASKDIITKEENETLQTAHALRRQVIMVDDFPQDLSSAAPIAEEEGGDGAAARRSA